ncbi:MAG: DUF5668 domain-containing protein [Oscillospiraceae bacterium]|jgi:4-hydroxybenzoate polyprenyltransferase|nr:DUF5668 domain-containing protein [Oscillospiraceae bacterium]
MKSKRIGILTLGLTLVGFGVLFLLRIAIPWFSYTYVLHFWPVVLIFLGIEVLLSLIVSGKDDPNPCKFDFVSVFLVFLLLALAFCMGALEQAIAYTPDLIPNL